MDCVFNDEPVEKQPLKLALITSKMICNSLYGELKETEDGDGFRHYEATFIAAS